MQAVEAYRSAWAEAERLGDFNEDILLRHLDSVTDLPEVDCEDEEHTPRNRDLGQELFVAAWRKRVPPKRLPRHLRRAGRRLLFGLLREFWGMLRSGWIPLWMHPPRNVNVYEAGERPDDDDDQDLIVIGVEVPLGDDWNRDLLMRAVAARPKGGADEDDDEELYHDIPVWVSASGTSPMLEVMVGKEHLVSAHSEVIWNFLRKIADEFQGIEGDLEVFDPNDLSRSSLDVGMVSEELPPEYVKDFFDGD